MSARRPGGGGTSPLANVFLFSLQAYSRPVLGAFACLLLQTAFPPFDLFFVLLGFLRGLFPKNEPPHVPERLCPVDRRKSCCQFEHLSRIRHTKGFQVFALFLLRDIRFVTAVRHTGAVNKNTQILLRRLQTYWIGASGKLLRFSCLPVAVRKSPICQEDRFTWGYKQKA